MKQFVYQVLLEPAEEGGYNVTVPDLPGCYTYGEDFKDAISMAADVLKLYVAEQLDEGIALPEPTKHPCPDGCESAFVSFETDENYGTKVIFAAEAARRLGVSRSRVSHMLRSGILEGFREWRNTFVTVESVERRLASNPKPGRPRKKASELQDGASMGRGDAVAVAPVEARA